MDISGCLRMFPCTLKPFSKYCRLQLRLGFRGCFACGLRRSLIPKLATPIGHMSH